MADPHSPSDTHPTTTTSSSSNDNSQPWHHYATPTTPLRLENGDLPESFPWHVTATKEYPVGLGVGVPFPTPPVLESGEGTTTPFWYREATRKRPVRVSSPARSPHTHTPDDSQEDALKFPFLAGVGTASSPFRLKPRRQKPGNGTSAPTSSFLRRTISTDAMSTTSSPSRILAKYPTSEYAYESEDAESTSGETVLTTRSEPVNLSKAAMRNRHRYGLVGIGLGLGVGHRINNVVPPPLPAPPIPAESHVAIEERSPRFVPEHARTAGELSERHLAKSELADRRQDVQMWLNTIMPDATGQTIHTPVSPAHSIRRQTSQSALGVKYILPVAAVAAVDVEGSKGRAVDQVVQSADAIRPTFILPTAQARRSEVKVEEDAHHRSVDGISSSCKTIVPTFIVPTAQGYTSQIEINAHREVDGITKSTDAIVPEFILPTAQACTSDISYTPKTTLHVLPVPSTPVTEVLPSGADATVVVTDTAPSKPKTDASTAHLTEIPPLDVKQATPPIAPPAAEPVDGGFEPGPRPHLKRRTRSLRISQEQGVDSISREPSQDVNAARAVSEILGSYGNDTLDRPQQPQFSAAKAISAKIMNARGQLSPNGGTLNTDAIQYTVRNSTYSDTCTSGVGTAVDSGVGDLRRSQDVTEAMYTGKSAEDTGHQVMMAHNDLNASTSSLMSHLRNVIAARAEVAVTDPGAYVKPVARGLPRWLEASKGQQQRRLSLDIASRPTGYAAGLGTKHQFSKSQNDVSHHTLGDGRQHEDDDMWARRYSDRTDTEPPEPHHYQVQDVEAAPPRSSLSHPQPNPLTTTTTTHQNRPGLLAFLVSLAASLAYISTWSVLNLTAAMMIRAPPFGPGLTSMMAAGFPQMAFLVPGVGGVPVWIYIGGMLGYRAFC
ncbi:uncharacterized protein EV422DRAFT_287712 [Fimicolochytrium jonesii]|uniref:uncharacterized protein n=1 Tax=Fimicolochytrium jonesii TaxID=1396493 RepID=UPI0022FDC395|nr:uncharacterized protein EV422DRAFT_287712 [Fimicolochytrium jonesii]KAI8816526.1 hypothetical protein EV422DRAFT_287712 [Fimicolochytrium jonesii]